MENIRWTHYTLIKQVKYFNNNQALQQMMFNYEPLLLKKQAYLMRNYKYVPLSYEDKKLLVQEVFYKMLIDYDPNRSAKFPTYVLYYFDWVMNNEIKKYTRKKYLVMNMANYDLDIKENELSNNDYDNKYNKYDEYEIESFFDILEKKLNIVEIEVLYYLKKGYPHKKIGSILNIDHMRIGMIKAKIVEKGKKLNLTVDML